MYFVEREYTTHNQDKQSSWYAGGKGWHPEGTLQTGEVGSWKTHEVQQGWTQDPAPGSVQSNISADERWMNWEQPCGGGLGEYQWLKIWIWAGNVGLQPREPTAPWLHQDKCDQQAEGSDSGLLLLWDPSWRTVSSFWPTSTRKTWTCLSGFRGRPQKWSECWNTSRVDKGWESWSLFCLKKRSYCICSVIKVGLQERRSKILPGPVMTGQGHQL